MGKKHGLRQYRYVYIFTKFKFFFDYSDLFLLQMIYNTIYKKDTIYLNICQSYAEKHYLQHICALPQSFSTTLTNKQDFQGCHNANCVICAYIYIYILIYMYGNSRGVVENFDYHVQLLIVFSLTLVQCVIFTT